MNGGVRITTRLAIVAMVTVGLTSCMGDSPTTTDASSAPQGCSTSGSRSVTASTVAVLGEGGPAISHYLPDLQKVVEAATDRQAHVIVNGVGSELTTPTLLANVVLTGEGPNSLARKKNLECKQKQITTAVRSSLANEPAPKDLDVFDALNTLEANLTGATTSSAVDVVLLSSLRSSGGLVDLANPKMLSNPAVTLNLLASHKLLPRCAGWRVYAVGGERTTPPMTSEQGVQLREFWRQYFHRCGGALVSWTDHLITFPVSSGEILPPDTAQITIKVSPRTVIATLTGDVIFDPGSSVLRKTASAQLSQILPYATKTTGRIVIDGFTDTGGDEADNLLLSQRRAAAVTDWLRGHGVAASRLSSIGHGSQNPVYPRPATDKQHQANRRVIVTVHND